MKQLENFLYNTPEPDVKVDGFERELRRSLLSSHSWRDSGLTGYRGGFFLSTSLAAVFGAILIVFILQPMIPGKVHYALLSDPDANLEFAGDTGLVPDARTLYGLRLGSPDGRAADRERAAEDVQRVFARDLDLEFVRYLAEREYQRGPVTVEPVISDEVYAVSRFRLDNGRDALVYTQVSTGRNGLRESY